MSKVTENGSRLCDVIVNCADGTGAEAISVVAAKEGADVLFSNLTNNYTTALLIQEAINRDMHLYCAVGYVEGYYDFMLQFIRSISGELDELGGMLTRISDKLKHKYEGQTEVNAERKSIEELLHVKSAEMRKIVSEIQKAAKYDCSVIINGESGTGKEMAANAMYRLSERKNGPFVKVNCAAIPKELLESEFFGYEKGAFTGARESGKDGFFKLADGGILLLDEVGEMPFELQAKLLRVIQEGEFYKVGGGTPLRVDVRVLASTNKDLLQLVRQGRFREDLYYRLAVFTITIPPLRKRRDDITVLADFFVEKYNEKYGISKSLTEEAKHCLLEYDWPGNVRELDNTIHRLMIHSGDDKIASADVLGEYNKLTEGDFPSPYGMHLGFNERIEEYEKNLITSYLDKYGSTYKAAEALNMTQSQLMRKKKKYGL